MTDVPHDQKGVTLKRKNKGLFNGTTIYVGTTDSYLISVEKSEW